MPEEDNEWNINIIIQKKCWICISKSLLVIYLSIRKYEKYKRITLFQGKCSLFNFKGTYLYEVFSILLN